MAPKFDFFKFHMPQVHNVVESAKEQADKAQKDKLDGDDDSSQKRLDRTHRYLDQISEQLETLKAETQAEIDEREERKRKKK